jgi:hypothetical protein
MELLILWAGNRTEAPKWSAFGLDAARKDKGWSEKRDERWNECAPQLGFRGQEGGCNVDGGHHR